MTIEELIKELKKYAPDMKVNKVNNAGYTTELLKEDVRQVIWPVDRTELSIGR